MSKPTIYDQHYSAFANVSAYVILSKGEKVATIAFKFPRDGAGRLYAYVHWLGVQMQRGFAGGYGYDKRTAAVQAACKKIEWPIDLGTLGPEDFDNAIASADGEHWDSALIKAGFEVMQAV